MAALTLDGTEFPSELTVKPLAFIGLAGLDTVNNAIHKTVWDAFANNRRPDRAPVQFQLLNNDYDFPVVKPKRNSYEWYVPKGILKRNWMHKHLSVIPAVIVIFYDLDWNDPQWNEKVIECASRVQSIRAAIEGHLTRLAVVTIQAGGSPSQSETTIGAERNQALCAACEIQSKLLFVLPHGDHLFGYTIRLENAFYDLSQNYYHQETRLIKLHRDHLNKTSHHYLFVRHQFKMGYLNELKQDVNTAHKHYLHAYNNLLEVRLTEANANEIKAVAGFINYKLCYLFFVMNMPRDSIAQLRAHVDRYKNKIGCNELLFEHYAWITRQYCAFGDLFDEAIKGGLSAVQSQHPGFYYQLAAQFTSLRRQACQQLCVNTSVYPQPDPLEGSVEFYGQRPWRPGRLNADPPDPLKEQSAIAAIQYNERQFHHSLVIISLLGNAIAQFKTYRSPRMRKHLVVEMANEYQLCGDYGQALTLLMHMLWDYRKEKWWGLATHIIRNALTCAFLSCSIHDYLTLSIEALGKNILLSKDEKHTLLENLSKILHLEIPGADLSLPIASIESAEKLWKEAIGKECMHVEIDMANLTSCFETKVSFTQNKYKIDELVSVAVYLRVSSPGPLTMSKISLSISSTSESTAIIVNEEFIPSVQLNSGKIKEFVCKFQPHSQNVNSELKIQTLLIYLGTPDKRLVALSYPGSGSHSTQTSIHPELLHFKPSDDVLFDYDNISPLTVAHLIPRESKIGISIEQANPALQGEWFPTTLHIQNDEDSNISNLNFALSFLGSPDNPNPESTVELSFDSPVSGNIMPIAMSLCDVLKEDKVTQIFFIKSNKVTSVSLLFTATYSILVRKSEESGDSDGYVQMDCSKEFPIKITVVKPFEVAAKFVTMHFENVTECCVSETLIVMPEIKILSPWPLLIENTQLEIAEPFQIEDGDSSSCLNGLEVSEGALTADAYCVTPMACTSDQPVRIGIYNIKWKRSIKGDENNLWNSVLSSAPLPSILIKSPLLGINTIFPASSDLQKPTPMVCQLKGSTDSPVKLTISADANDAFMFSGYKKHTLTIPPGEEQVITYNLYPLICGANSLPKLHPTLLEVDSTSVELQASVEAIFDKNVPQKIYIMPREKE